MLSNRMRTIIGVLLVVTTLAGCGGSGNSGSNSSGNNGAQLVAISITPTNSQIAANTSQQLSAIGIYSDNSKQDLTGSVTWSSSDTTVVMFSEVATTSAKTAMVMLSQSSNGHAYAYGKKAGHANISATLGNTSSITPIAVTNATLVSIAVTPDNQSISRETSQQCTATGTFSDNTTQDLTASATWSSSNAGVATVSNAAGFNGLATSVAAGTTTITAASGSITGSTTLTVNPAALVSIAVTPSNPGIVQGTTTRLAATGMFSDGTTQDLTAAAIWSTSNAGVATVSSAIGSYGLATSVAAGTSTITATSGGMSGSTTLTVNPATLVSITVTPVNPGIAQGTTKQFAATGTFSDNTTQDLTASATWSSSNAGVATVSNAAGSNGLATTVAAGTTTITAASGSITGSTSLTVTPATLVSITVTPSNPGIAKGTTKQFVATGAFSDGTTQNLTAAVTWSSSNAGVATVSNAAGSNGLATPVAAGTTTITAASGSITGSTSLTVTPATLVSITVSPSSPSLAQGANQQFTATGTFSDGTTQNLTTAVTWNSSTTGAVSISNAVGSKGLTTAVAPGTTTITAVFGSVSGYATLTVTAITVTGSATLSWNAPTTNTDGTPLTDLAGYKIHYGTSPGNYTSSINIGNVTTYTINNLSAGTYYFAVTAYDSAGIESIYSNQASKTL